MRCFALLHIDCEDARILQGISDDTRDVKKDWLFVCRKGSLYDGAAFLQEALDKGGSGAVRSDAAYAACLLHTACRAHYTGIAGAVLWGIYVPVCM